MLAALGLAFHHGTVVVAAFLAVAKRLALDIAERVPIFTPLAALILVSTHVDAADSPARR